MNQRSPSAATAIPLETLQAFGLAGKVQQEFQRQRWLSALPEARDPLPETALGGEPLRVPPPTVQQAEQVKLILMVLLGVSTARSEGK
jgi:hypothetical protein